MTVFWVVKQNSANSISRRTVLGWSGPALAAAVAGCTNPSGDTSGGETTTAAETTATTDTNDDHSHGANETDDGGHDDHGQEDATLAGPAKEATVRMSTDGSEHHFEPHVVWVESGGTVTWTLAGGAHSTTAYHPDNDRSRRVPSEAASWDSGVLSTEGERFERSFDVEGVYDYFCIPHEDGGMVGSVVVGHPDPTDQPGLAPPDGSLSEAARDRIAGTNERVRRALEHAD